MNFCGCQPFFEKKFKFFSSFACALLKKSAHALYAAVHAAKIDCARLIERSRFDREISLIVLLFQEAEKPLKINLSLPDMQRFQTCKVFHAAFVIVDVYMRNPLPYPSVFFFVKLWKLTLPIIEEIIKYYRNILLSEFNGDRKEKIDVARRVKIPPSCN